MKKVILLICVFISCTISAQDNQHLTLHAGETPIEQQMTEEQKKEVTHLNITGKLLDEDYAFLRTTLHAQLLELNLRDADIDTIPAHALEPDIETQMRCYEPHNIILPERLICLGDSSLNMGCCCTLQITGYFPSRGNAVINPPGTCFTVSPDNPNCMDRELPYDNHTIYSADGDTLFAVTYMTSEVIAEGTKVIAGHVFEGQAVNPGSRFVIPASVDSIGDMAFHDIIVLYTEGWGDIEEEPECVNLSSTPQRLAPNAFGYEKGMWLFVRDFILRVPEESVDIYRETEVWKEFGSIKPIMKDDVIYDKVSISSQYDNEFNYSFGKSGNCNIMSHKDIKAIHVFSVTGALLEKYAVHGKTYTLNLKKGTGTPLLINIIFEDGKRQIIKPTNSL